MARFSLILHGGYGGARNMPRLNCISSLLKIGHDLLKNGEASLEVVERMVKEMENSGLFNAGKGSVPTLANTIEMDAAIMDGTTGRAGAATLISGFKNPVSVARAVLNTGSLVFVGAHGARDLALEKNLPEVDSYYFHPTPLAEPEHYGTVGCVAWDIHGHLAAATSTGGTRHKPLGRIGDSPIIGAGTYANNATCAISCTGKGEAFLLANAGHMTSALMEYRELSLQASLDQVLARVESFDGTGGMIAINREGGIGFAASHQELLCAAAITEEGKIIFPFESMN